MTDFWAEARGLLGFFEEWIILFDAAIPDAVHFFWAGNDEWPNDAEAEELGIGVVPDTFGELRILDFPSGGGGAASGDAEGGGFVVVPGATAGGMRVRFGGFIPGIFRGGRLIESGVILIESPLEDIAEDIVEAPRVGLFFCRPFGI